MRAGLWYGDCSLSVFSTGDSSGYPYEDQILGRTIDSPGDRRKEMKKQGLIERG